mmetsp:Transcript_22000/g.65108  ORF Transcript_22000/g.65108 Transcript_22000/m.65108 type:complete len:208 (+) Transcript_22000:1058-1681(+)
MIEYTLKGLGTGLILILVVVILAAVRRSASRTGGGRVGSLIFFLPFVAVAAAAARSPPVRLGGRLERPPIGVHNVRVGIFGSVRGLALTVRPDRRIVRSQYVHRLKDVGQFRRVTRFAPAFGVSRYVGGLREPVHVHVVGRTLRRGAPRGAVRTAAVDAAGRARAPLPPPLLPAEFRIHNSGRLPPQFVPLPVLGEELGVMPPGTAE